MYCRKSLSLPGEDKFYSATTRMVHAGHSDPNTLNRHYMPTNSADGQDIYLGGKGRTIVADLFRKQRRIPCPKEEIAILEDKIDKKSVSRREECCYWREDDPESGLDNQNASYDWRHIYTYYKRNCSIYGFAELCFHCNKWFFGFHKSTLHGSVPSESCIDRDEAN